MTTDLTIEILQQLRADIADVKTDIADLKSDVDGRFGDVKADIAGLRKQMNRRFQHVDRQFSATFALMGTLVDNDREHERRLDALESRSTDR